MKLLIGFLTFLLVLDSLLMMLLVLIQLPKKEAGLGTAFGGAATDALFGAGTGNVLTKITKYTAALFLGFSMLLSILIAGEVKQPKGPGVEDVLKRKAGSAGVVTPGPILGTNQLGQATSAAPILLLPNTNILGSNAVPAPAK